MLSILLSKAVIDAFKKNEILKFQMITDPEGVPPGTELYKKKSGNWWKGS